MSESRISRRKYLKYVGGLAAAAVAAGAGYSIYQTSQPAPGPTLTTTQKSTAPGKPIRIGVTSGLTGLDSQVIHTATIPQDMWAEQVNSHGGLLGRPVEWVRYDDKADTSFCAVLYEKLIMEDKVDLLFSPFGTGVTHAAVPIADKHGMVIISTVTLSEELNKAGFKHHFCVWPTGTDVYRNYLQEIFNVLETVPADERPKTMGIVTFDYEANQGMRRSMKEYWAPKYGIDVVLDEVYPDPTIDFTPTLSKVKAANPDFFFANTMIPDCFGVFRAAKQVDFNPKLAFNGVGMQYPGIRKDLGDAAQHVFFPGIWMPVAPWTKAPGCTEFMDEYAKRAGEEATYAAAATWVGLQILQKAVEDTQSLDQEKLREYLSTTRFDTLMGSQKFDANGIAEYNCKLLQVFEGNAVCVGPANDKTQDPVYPRPKPWG